MDILNTTQVKEILDIEPEADFSLQPVRVEFTNSPGHMIAGYHIFKGQIPRMINVKGDEIWEYVLHPGP